MNQFSGQPIPPLRHYPPNLVIVVSGRGSGRDFSVMITDVIPDLGMIGCGQCFPLYLYEWADSGEAFI